MDLDKRTEFWIEELKDYHTVIIANGEIADSPLSLYILKSRQHLVCCDGALQKLLSMNILPDVVVGDGDSMDTALLAKHGIPYYADKSTDYNDLQKALKHCISKRRDNILLLGCGGLREDHLIANISIMCSYSDHLHLKMLTEHGVFDVFRNENTFRSFKGMQVSVFSKDPQTKLTFNGLKYPVKEKGLDFFWSGSLNEALGDSFRISANNEAIILVYRTK